MKKTILTFHIITYVSYCLVSCGNHTKNETKVDNQIKNEVIMLGMIHSGHLTSEKYGIEVLTDIVKEINPDYILTEIPPDRYDDAASQFRQNDSISEPRVVRFPEYIDVIFPLTKEMNFEIIPTAGWTKEMADARSKRMSEIRKDSAWAEKWSEFEAAGSRSDSALSALGDKDDPYIINSEAYDEAVELELSVYNEYFNDELGDGGWDNINKKHYGYIAQALDEHQGEGKRILITYGAGHKGWFLKQLRQRKDIKIIETKPFLDRAIQASH